MRWGYEGNGTRFWALETRYGDGDDEARERRAASMCVAIAGSRRLSLVGFVLILSHLPSRLFLHRAHHTSIHNLPGSVSTLGIGHAAIIWILLSLLLHGCLTISFPYLASPPFTPRRTSPQLINNIIHPTAFAPPQKLLLHPLLSKKQHCPPSSS
jgi:hypothetical protein